MTQVFGENFGTYLVNHEIIKTVVKFPRGKKAYAKKAVVMSRKVARTITSA